MTTVEQWVEGYQRAAKSDDPNDIAALFTENAAYHTGPFDEPWQGRDDIVRRWIDRGDSGLEWEFRYEILATDGNRTLLEAWTNYTSPHYSHSYNNVWLIELEATGRASLFKEWWLEDPATRSD